MPIVIDGGPVVPSIRQDIYIEPRYDAILLPLLMPMESDQSMSMEYNITYSSEETPAIQTSFNIGTATMVEWNTFHEYVMPSVQGCPATMVDTAIRSACSEFCAKSFIWRQESTLTDLYEGVATYAFAPPKGAKVVTPYRVSIYGKEIYPTDLDTLEVSMPDWRERTQDMPTHYFLDNDNTIRLIGIPEKDMEKALTAGVVLKPSRTSVSCPNFIHEDWAEVIAAGALSKLLAMRGKIWAQEGLVEYYNNLFRAGISRAKSKAAKSYQRSAADMNPVKFYLQ